MPRRIPITEKELRSLQREIHSLTETFDLVADHVIITDANGNILYANKGVEDATGFSREEIIGKTPGDLWGGIAEKSFYEDLWNRIKIQKRPFYGEVENQRKDGMRYWQQLRIFPVYGDKGEARFFIGIEPDITIRKAFEGHQRQYIEEMARLNDYLSGREVKMKELTKEVRRLRKRLKERTDQ